MEEGVFLASRSAASARPTHRAAATARGYELRARHRPTPHGVFAGVASAKFTDDPATLSLGTHHVSRTHPSGQWLTEAAGVLLNDPALLGRLTFTTGDLIGRSGDRWEWEGQTAEGVVERRSVRATPAVDLVLRTCAQGASLAEVTDAVTAAFSSAPCDGIRSTVTELTRLGALVTDLLPVDVTSDPLGHVMARLPRDHSAWGSLAALRDLLTAADARAPGDPERGRFLAAARDAADHLVRGDRPLACDTRVDALIALPRHLARQAADAGAVLWRVAATDDPLRAFHDAFLERFGRSRRVPLADLVDPVTEIGPGPGSPSPARNATLARMLAGAIADGRPVSLTDALVAELDKGGEPPRSAEIVVRVVAFGERLGLAVVPGGGSQHAGATLGRFTGLLGEPAPGRTRDEVELVVRPRVGSALTLAPPTGWNRHRIPVGVPCGPSDLPLEDLSVFSDGHRLFVWSARLNRTITPVLHSRLSLDLVPPVARLLTLLGRSGTRPWKTWSWGVLTDAPWTPRVLRGPVVLHPARWAVPAELRAAADGREEWGQGP
ncbi:lantibiotic dehydratase family protein [Actinocorallia sp. A-T 12471]|uniref:lantibiotic dehydratase family protein n=1 Tax=Actinocorallia sp. A-T 12471 TaxID=3089813 RepID=UPI0029CC488D|nr:lantibiotic dehydratase family protein [Actinocorallia sp. A-T 12471]MDX6738366.1 lantibiotic dehydratase family protein [Actinocorallia sp. A-T 12471]